MEQETKYVVNELIDAVEELTRLVEDLNLNPSAAARLDRVKFFVNRADRTVKQTDVSHG